MFCTAYGCRTLTVNGYRDDGFKCGGYGADANAGRRYCTSCTCVEPLCSAQRYKANSRHAASSYACTSHRCPSQGCDQPRETNALYCIEHKICSKQFCDNARKVGRLYCSEHEMTCVRVDCFENRQHLGEYYWKREGWKQKRRWRATSGFAEACSSHT